MTHCDFCEQRQGEGKEKKTLESYLLRVGFSNSVSGPGYNCPFPEFGGFDEVPVAQDPHPEAGIESIQSAHGHPGHGYSSDPKQRHFNLL